VNEVSRLLNDPDYLGADDEAQDPFQDRSHRAAIPDEAADVDTTPPFQTLARYSTNAAAAADSDRGVAGTLDSVGIVSDNLRPPVTTCRSARTSQSRDSPFQLTA
jgi:hypothetical protein